MLGIIPLYEKHHKRKERKRQENKIQYSRVERKTLLTKLIKEQAVEMAVKARYFGGERLFYRGKQVS